MVRIRRYKRLHRTTLGEFLANPRFEFPGCYLLASYPVFGVLYIGKSENVGVRLLQHLSAEGRIGDIIRNNMVISHGWRLDVFEAPDESWPDEAERRLMSVFRPLLNEQLQAEYA